MADLASIIADVYTLTNRPDLIAETLLAVKSATLKAHQSDYYPKDLAEVSIQFAAADYYQTLYYKSVVPRLRSLSYVRIFDNSYNTSDPYSQTATDFLEILNPNQVLDSYNTNKTNVCYLAGDSIEFRLYTQQQYFLLGAYLNPDVTSDGYSSWIADEHPYLIVYEAARVVFKTIGYDEQSSTYEKLVLEQLQLLRQNNILAVGY